MVRASEAQTTLCSTCNRRRRSDVDGKEQMNAPMQNKHQVRREWMPRRGQVPAILQDAHNGDARHFYCRRREGRPLRIRVVCPSATPALEPNFMHAHTCGVHNKTYVKSCNSCARRCEFARHPPWCSPVGGAPTLPHMPPCPATKTQQTAHDKRVPLARLGPHPAKVTGQQ